MSRPEKITLVVITFRNDFQLLDRLLASIYAYWDTKEVAEIIVVMNDKYEYMKPFNDLVDACEEPSIPIRRLWANELSPEMDQYDWYSQQFLKLLVSDLVNTDWFVIHDCKDYYKGHCNLTYFFSDSCQAYGCVNLWKPNNMYTGPGIFEAEYTRAYRLWGMDFRNHKNFTLKYVTPFICRTQTIKDLVSDLRKKFQTVFDLLLFLQKDHKPLFTEFALISAYVTFKGQLLMDYTMTEPNYNNYHYIASRSKDLRRIEV